MLLLVLVPVLLRLLVLTSPPGHAWLGHGWSGCSKVREHSSDVERCGPHVAISCAMLRSSNWSGCSKVYQRPAALDVDYGTCIKIPRCV